MCKNTTPARDGTNFFLSGPIPLYQFSQTTHDFMFDMCRANVNATNKRDGSTALHAAAMQNHAPVVKYLLVNCKPSADMTIIDNRGR